MRRVLTYLVVALVVGGAVGTLMSRDPGYVLVSYENMSLETSLWFALLALIVGYYLLRVVIGLLPNKGFPLPLVSSGGSSLLINLLGMGVLLNISQHESADA